MKTKPKKKSIAMLAVPAGICVAALSISVFFLVQITGRMNLSANQNLLTSSKVISEGLHNKISLDRELLFTLANMLASEQESAVGETLQGYAKSTDFFHFVYVNMDGEGINSDGNSVHVSDLPFEELALSTGKDGLSAPYYGASGRLQITYQSPVRKDEKQIGAIYADRIINDYNLPTLFTFNNGEGFAYVVDSGGNYIIESRGTAEQPDIYSYLAMQGNSGAVQDTLRRVIREGISGTLVVKNENQKSLLGFLPLDAPEGSYLITMIPRAVLQRESTPIIIMLYTMFAFLLLGAVAIANLVTGRQSMREDARQKEYREKLFRNLSANIDFVFLLYTPSAQKVELVSDNLPVLLGITAQQVQERPELVFSASGMAPDDPAGCSFLDGTLKEQVTREAMVGDDPNEVKRWFAVHMIPADYGQYLAVFQETTKEHNMRQHLADALLQAQNSNRARTAFFSSMSHDIRTPMNGIIGMTNVALKSLDNMEKVESCLNKITAASGHLLELINEVLDMSRIESGKIRLKEENVHLPSMIANLISFIRPDMDKMGQIFQLKSQILEHDTVISDGLHLQKILLNLLSNAMKYTQAGGIISLKITETKVDTDTIRMRFVVEDNGIGMTSEFLERIFTPFERAEDSRMSQAAGTGLGLAITKSIVEMMEGDIYVESEKDMGSRFTVEIPLKLPKQQVQELPDLAGYSVLVADDDQDACESISLILQETGIRADWVTSGIEAVEKAWQAHTMEDDYCVVIVDWKMPDVDGVETARRIRARLGSGMPILLLSAYDWENVKEEAIQAGINGFLTKPIFKADILERLKQYIQGGYQEDEEQQIRESDNLEGVRILVADDNELNLEIMFEIFNSSGAAVDCAHNGKEALEAYLKSSQGYYQIILMDVHMPEMNGLEATKEIRNSGRPDACTVPIIAMTADVFKEDIRRCQDAGMNAHMGKPVELDKLYSTVRKLLNKEALGEKQ